MMKQVQVFVAAWLACAAWAAAHAAEFDVGRATVVFSTDGWREMPLPAVGLKYTGDREGALAAERKLLIKESPQHGIEAVVLMRSNRGLAGVQMTYSRRCNTTDGFFAEGTTGDALRVAHCLRVFPLYSVASLLADMGEDVEMALKSTDGKFPGGMHAVTSEYWNTTGTALHAYVLLAPGIKNSEAPGALDAALPKGVEVGHVVWGRKLNRAVRASVHSLFGTMEFPEVTLEAPAGATAKPMVTGQPQ